MERRCSHFTERDLTKNSGKRAHMTHSLTPLSGVKSSKSGSLGIRCLIELNLLEIICQSNKSILEFLLILVHFHPLAYKQSRRNRAGRRKKTNMMGHFRACK
ncbi:hypothetical protein AVEN_85212-1 [Araneus ventricosus]|uniref:Uncharacterized protein n=1 Tax=Araneus ventricosus TaxID=182803 RepID=A0A4Y2EEA3_ARAVE|nr:hypothetical protein AVEN_85212-1 [Araneus ventricosus]